MTYPAFFQTIAGILWFAGATLYASQLGDSMSFHMALALGHMTLGAIVTFHGITR